MRGSLDARYPEILKVSLAWAHDIYNKANPNNGVFSKGGVVALIEGVRHIIGFASVVEVKPLWIERRDDGTVRLCFRFRLYPKTKYATKFRGNLDRVYFKLVPLGQSYRTASGGNGMHFLLKVSPSRLDSSWSGASRIDKYRNSLWYSACLNIPRGLDELKVTTYSFRKRSSSETRNGISKRARWIKKTLDEQFSLHGKPITPGDLSGVRFVSRDVARSIVEKFIAWSANHSTGVTNWMLVKNGKFKNKRIWPESSESQASEAQPPESQPQPTFRPQLPTWNLTSSSQGVPGSVNAPGLVGSRVKPASKADSKTPEASSSLATPDEPAEVSYQTMAPAYDSSSSGSGGASSGMPGTFVMGQPTPSDLGVPGGPTVTESTVESTVVEDAHVPDDAAGGGDDVVDQGVRVPSASPQQKKSSGIVGVAVAGAIAVGAYLLSK